MKRTYILLLLGSVLLLAGCQTREKAEQIQEELSVLIQEKEKPIHVRGKSEPVSIQEENQAPVQEEEYTVISPENLCPFTVEVYPEALTVGDPLYVSLNFRNNTSTDMFALAEPIGLLHTDGGMVGFHFMESDGKITPWVLFNGASLPKSVGEFWFG